MDYIAEPFLTRLWLNSSPVHYLYKLLEKASRSWYYTWFSMESWHLTRTGMVNEMVHWGLRIHWPTWSESAALLGQVCQQTSPPVKHCCWYEQGCGDRHY